MYQCMDLIVLRRSSKDWLPIHVFRYYLAHDQISMNWLVRIENDTVPARYAAHVNQPPSPSEWRFPMKCLKRLLFVILLIGIISILHLLDDRSIHSIPTQSSKSFRMSAMGNATLKAELGRSTWHLLHTMTVKYPLEPTKAEQQQYLDFIDLFSRLYPCGECAEHFRRLLKKHPPRVGSRDEVIIWLCDVHNLVNERLNKPIVDCSKVKEMWKCGCADEEETLTLPDNTKNE